MPVQLIELEEMVTFEMTDETLEQTVHVGENAYSHQTCGPCF